MTNLNENIVPVMIAFIFAIIIFAKLSDYYGYHQYHFYVEYTKIDGVDFKSRWASGFIDLKHADFSEGQKHIAELINKFILQDCDNGVIETDSLQLKSLSKLD